MLSLQMPPPLPKITDVLRSEHVLGPKIGDFSHSAGTTDEVSEQAAELEPGIPGLNIDPNDLPPPPVQSEAPVKKKPGGSFLDYFSKRPPRRKRVARLTPDSIVPPADAEPNPTVPTNQHPTGPVKQVPAATNGVWSEESPKFGAMPQPVEEPSSETNPASLENVDDDLSNFFKKLE